MKKIIFDASLYLGQFNIMSEKIRLACKSSLSQISLKEKDEIVGVCTFNENSWIDHVVWNLHKEEQNSFYQFMDTFHSLKNIIRVPLLLSDIQNALEISTKLDLEISCALTCAVAIRENVQEIHTLYEPLLQEKVKNYMNKFEIIVKYPDVVSTNVDHWQLENFYQETFGLFKKQNLNILKTIKQCGNNLIQV